MIYLRALQVLYLVTTISYTGVGTKKCKLQTLQADLIFNNYFGRKIKGQLIYMRSLYISITLP